MIRQTGNNLGDHHQAKKQTGPDRHRFPACFFQCQIIRKRIVLPDLNQQQHQTDHEWIGKQNATEQGVENKIEFRLEEYIRSQPETLTDSRIKTLVNHSVHIL